MFDIQYSLGKLIIRTDDPTVHLYLEKTIKKWEYIPWKKQWGYVNYNEKIYNNSKKKTIGTDGLFYYEINQGWAAYIASTFSTLMNVEQKDWLISNIIKASTYRTAPFSNLRDYQNDDILFLLKYRIGLFACSVGYGKSECIATLVNEFLSLGKKILLVTPSNKARDELVKRCKIRYNIDVTDSDSRINGICDALICQGLLHSKKYTDPTESDKFKSILASYDIVMSDEVEYCINPGGKFIFDNCTGAERIYGFSGTSDKSEARIITFHEGLSETIIENKDLVGYFGPALVYRLPLEKKIKNIKIHTSALDDIVFDDIKGDNIYQEVMNKLWTEPSICNVLVKIFKKFPMTFVPMNNLARVITYWLDNYILGNFRTLLICGKGYLYYTLDKTEHSLTLNETAELAKKCEIDLVLSTSAGYRALDLKFPEESNIVLCQSKIAGVVIQSIGRIARSDRMNIISLVPMSNKKIPVYSKSVKDRDSQLQSYYQYCDIENIDILEEDL